MPDNPPPNWRDTGSGPADSGGTRPWQPNESAGADPAAGPSKRSLKRTIALMSLIAILVLIGFVFVLLQPIKPACLVLIGSGYENNLLLPHNACGWNGLNILEAEVTEQESGWRFPWDQPTKMRRMGERIELKDKGWKEIWSKIDIGKQNTLVLFISLHGIADKDDAYLLANMPKVQSVKSFNPSRTPFSDVLDSLESVDSKKKILVLLDVSHVQSHWPIGMLHNDFIKRLQEKYEARIKKMGNLTVICSASADQRSWASDEWQNSIFSHYVTQGLKGAGKRAKERVSALNLFKYVEEKVDKWAQTNRARNQTPIMLGDESVARATELILIADAISEERDPPGRNFDPESVKPEWTRWQELKERAPYVSSPHLWRLYQETLLRYEQLLRAGDPTKRAPELKTQLDGLHVEIAKSRSLNEAFASLGNNFPIQQVLGYRGAPQNFNELFTNLRKKSSDEERIKLLEAIRKRPLPEKQYLQVRLSQTLLKEVVQQGKVNRTRDKDWLDEIERELAGPRRPTEAHLLKMLDNADSKLDDDTIKQALSVRILAEETALSAHRGDTLAELYSEVIFPWIQKDVEKADALRRQGEDFLFGDPLVHTTDARDKLKQAKDLYLKTRDQAEKLQQALAFRDELSADLPFFANWLASLPRSANQNKEKIKSLRLVIESLGSRLADLNRELDVARKLTFADELPQLADDLKSLRDEYQSTGEKLKNAAVLQQNWHSLDAALRIPPADMKEEDIVLRINLLSNLGKISAELLKSSDGKAEEEEPVAQRVARQRTILRASLKSLDDIQGQDKDHDDDKVRGQLMKLPMEIAAKSEGLAGEEPDLDTAANWSRTIPGALADQLRNEKSERINPGDRLRNLRMFRLLNWLAQRTLDDHWWEPGPGKGPYYVHAGNAYLDGARGLFDKSQMSKALLKEAEDMKAKLVPASLSVLKQPSPYWTTEFDFPLPWQIKADGALPTGTPMVWLEVMKGKNAEKIWQPKPRKAMTAWPAPTPYADPFYLNRTNLFDEGDVKVTLHSLYRGQDLTNELILVRPTPNLIVRHFPAPEKGGLAVRLDSKFNYGSISIVLDNSGSMKWLHPIKDKADVVIKDGTIVVREPDEKKEEKSRYKYATSALRKVLQKIPDNTYLSFVTLGEKDKTGATLFLPPFLWRQSNIDDLIPKLENIPLDYSSPIAEGVALSMNSGFPAEKGPKVVLVLTDGVDNFADGQSRDPTKSAADVASALKKTSEAHPDTDVVVVCFIDEKILDKDNDEYTIAKEQFDGVKKFTPKSAFIREPKGDDLARTIENIIRPLVQLKLGGEPAPGFVNGLPSNYHQDLALKWSPVTPNNFRATILRTYPNDIGVEMGPGQSLFAVLKRKEKTFFLERGVLANQPEVVNLAYQQEKDGWKVSLLENQNNLENKLSQLLAFEKADLEDATIRQIQPGFTWLDLDAVKGKKPKETLKWGRDWCVPAPALRLEMPNWLGGQHKVSAWFSPEERGKLLLNEKLVARATVSTGSTSPTTPAGQIDANPIIESVLWEPHEVDHPAGGKVKENCLVVRVRHAKGRPVWIGLDKERPEAGSEHHYYLDAGRCTAYFYKLPKLDEVKLVLIDVEAFKETATRVEFSPEQRFRAPKMFLNCDN